MARTHQSHRRGRRSRNGASKQRSRITNGRWILVLTAAATLTIHLLMSLADSVWLLDAANHFRTWISLASLVLLTSVWALADRRGWLTAGLVGCLILMMTALPGLTSFANVAAPVGTHRLRVVTFNIYGRNERMDEAVRWLHATEADVIALQEVSYLWNRAVEFSALAQMTRIEGANGSVDLMTTVPPHSSSTHSLPGRRAVALAVMAFDGAPVCVVSIHPNTASTAASWRARNEDLRIAAYWIATRCPAGAEKVVMGDWNTSPWSGHFRLFLRVNDLRWANASPWPEPTRLFGPPLQWLGAPIDQVATTPGLKAVKCERGPAAGSDHRPILCEIARVRSR